MRDVIDMAREAWLDTYGLGKDHISFVEALKRFEALVRADERKQVALDKKAENARELGLDYEPVPENFMDALKFDVAMRDAAPVQEPVAYLCENAVGHKYFRWKKPSSTYKPIALYTTPPAQPAPVKVWEAEGYDALMQEMQMVKARNIRQHAEIERLKAAQPAPVQKRPQNCGTSYCSCIECVMEPAVPDAFGTREGEHPQYIQGWNDCRAETLKMRKP
jgi:hypothetical protein